MLHVHVGRFDILRQLNSTSAYWVRLYDNAYGLRLCKIVVSSVASLILPVSIRLGHGHIGHIGQPVARFKQ